MRLIDADEIVKETWGVVIKDMFHMDETVDVISRKDIDNAPTVKAIPIEWIEKQMAERENYGDFNTAGAIGYLLLSWEEEMAEPMPICNDKNAVMPYETPKVNWTADGYISIERLKTKTIGELCELLKD